MSLVMYSGQNVFFFLNVIATASIHILNLVIIIPQEAMTSAKNTDLTTLATAF